MARKPPARLPKALASARTDLRVLRHITSAKILRMYVGLSQRELGKLVKCSGGLVGDWEAGRRKMRGEALTLLGSKLASMLTRDIGQGRTIGVKIEVNSPWTVTAWSWCTKCDGEFQLERARDRTCPKCRRQRRGKN